MGMFYDHRLNFEATLFYLIGASLAAGYVSTSSVFSRDYGVSEHIQKKSRRMSTSKQFVTDCKIRDI